MLELVSYPDPRLLKPAEPCVSGDDLKALAEEMLSIMYVVNGVGLSANQVGVGKRLFVIHVRGQDRDEKLVAINPKPIKANSPGPTPVIEQAAEGCLSMRGLSVVVPRSPRVEIEYDTLEGGRKTYHATGLMARAIQHEMDHLDGKLIVHYLGTVKRRMLEAQMARDRREYHRRQSARAFRR